jgi:hypothetical protein
MVALLVTFLPRNAQHFIQWGGDPTVLALGLLVMGLAFLPPRRKNDPQHVRSMCPVHMCPIKPCPPLGTGLLGLDAKVGA